MISKLNRRRDEQLAREYVDAVSECSALDQGHSLRVAVIGTRGYPSYYGGFETAIRKVAPFLAEQGWEVTVFGRPAWLTPKGADHDVRVKALTSWGLETKHFSTLTFGLSATIKTMLMKPDVALVMNVANGLWIPFLWLRGIPTLVHVDGIEWEREKWGGLARRVFLLGANMSKVFATSLIYDAQEISERWEERFGRKGFLIPYGGEPRPTLECPLGLNSGDYMLVVARLVPENSIPEVIQAIRLMPTDVQVVIVGSSGSGGPLEMAVAELASSREHTLWTGHLSDDDVLHGLWQHAGVYFHGHTVGGTNPALVQAMALGAPVVAADTPYNREVMGESGIFARRDPQSIATAVLNLLRDDSLRLAQSSAAIDRARTKYTWQEVGARYSAALRVVAAHRRFQRKGRRP